ncbi:peptidoglycan editing factor PgeF [uncultured Rhodospira sp.]|uniref:peptidoglycan editing factor PgeF n=1 Tax=uncultured Rhodospira sp. TaxID=1936189 RepID=UPI002636AE6E|nr:peptidoglycan editing factor PgeF [uncultured Rhodospira sp.]
MITVSALNALSRVRHAFCTRDGGISEGLYESNNCGYSSSDDPANVAKNRQKSVERMEMPPEALVTVSQQHTTDVVVTDKPWPRDAMPVADAIVTTRPRLVLGVLTADCAPVLMADGKAGVVAAVHAGWRGALNGVLANTVATMTELGAKPDRIIVGIGPCIGQRSYEVGPEFPAPFLEQDETNAAFFADARREGHFLFDLPGFVAKQLSRAGVREIMPTPCDTCREEARFFSHRRATLRGEEDYGRQLSAIALER